MNSAARLFCDYLEQRKVRYHELGPDAIRVSYAGDNCPSIAVNFKFSDDGRDVAIRCYSIAKIKEEDAKQYLGALYTCSELNRNYRWVKFYLDSDNEVTAEDDAVIDPYTTGEECYKLLGHMVNIVDETYPVFMKIVWGLD